MNRLIHVCQSVPGALRNWGRKEWESVARSNGWTVQYAKEKFRIMDFEGKQVIPFGPPCEGFSYETGCPGHVVSADTSTAGAVAREEKSNGD